MTRGLYDRSGNPLPLRSQSEWAMDIAAKISAFLACAGSGLGAVATGGWPIFTWPEKRPVAADQHVAANSVSRGAAPAHTKEAKP